MRNLPIYLAILVFSSGALGQIVDYGEGVEIDPASWARPATPEPEPEPEPAGPAPSADVPCPPGTSAAPPFQPAYSGIYQSLTFPNHQIYYVHGGVGGASLQVTILLGNQTWWSGEVIVTTPQRELLLPLFDPQGNQRGTLKICSPPTSSDANALCTNIHARAVINDELVFPNFAEHMNCGPGNTTCLQRFAEKTAFPGTLGPCLN